MPYVALTAALVALLACGAVAALWAAQPSGQLGTLVDLPLLPTLGSRFTLGVDPLGAPLAVFVAGIAAPVLVFTAAYMPHHLDEERQSPAAGFAFCFLMLAFVLVMLLLLLAQDVLVIFLALELTALVSFLLIRFDIHKADARRAALVALVVTAGSSLVFLIGALMVAEHAGSLVIADLRAEATADLPPAAVICLVVGVLAKSAQVPLHFWLPRAMIAPTPVSAYLHSAALVAAGVFVLQRLRFLLEASPGVLDALLWLGFLSIAVGGILALTSDAFKRILAYSTVAQYGYAVALVGAGGEHGAFGAPFFLVAHGLAKCALFMTAGAVTATTGEERLSHSGGLARRMPLLALGSALAAAGLAGMPLTVGYFKDDLLLKASLSSGPVFAVLATAALALTLAYTARFWFGIFGGTRREAPGVALGLSLPVLVLAVPVVFGGVAVGLVQPAFEAAGAWISREPLSVHLAYEFTSPAGLLALTGWVVGVAVALALRLAGDRLAQTVAAAAEAVGPAAWTDRLAAAGAALSDRLHDMEVRDMRDRLTSVLAPTALFVLLGIWAQGGWPSLGPLNADAWPLAGSLLLLTAAAVAAAFPLSHLPFVLQLSFVGFSMALVFALALAPDVALVLVLIETAFTLLFLALISQIRPKVLAKARERIGSGRGPLAGITAGVVATATAWLALSNASDRPVAVAQIEATEEAHAKDIVTAILADFRGLDTAGEVSVLVVAMFGAIAIVWGRRK